jgi:hypothetical protein
MKINKLLTILIVSCLAPVFSHAQCDLTKEYDSIFEIKRMTSGEKQYLIPGVKKIIDTTKCYSTFLTNNHQYLNYLRLHFSEKIDYDTLNKIEDSASLQSEYIAALRRDTAFNRILQKLSATLEHEQDYAPDTVSINSILDIAVKFFSISKITDKGYYAAKVCVGINGIKETIADRQPYAEAFCFQAIINDMMTGESSTYQDFIQNIKSLYDFNLGTDKEDQLLRAQGALFVLMSQSASLQTLLLNEYEEKKDFLPFIIQD